MSFDDLITALLVLLFVVVPIVRGALRSRRRSSGQGSAPPPRPGSDSGEPAPEPRSGAPSGPADRRTGAPTPRSATGDSRGDGSGSRGGSGGDSRGDRDEIERMLEQARRRVAEALGEPSASSGSAGSGSAGSGSARGSLSGGQAVGRGLAGGTTPAPAGAGSGASQSRPSPISGSFLGREGRPGDEGRPPPFAAPLAAPPTVERGLQERARLQPHRRPVTRTQPTSPAPTATLRYGFRVDREAIVQGFLWHQILSEPVAKRSSQRPTRLPRTHRD